MSVVVVVVDDDDIHRSSQIWE